MTASTFRPLIGGMLFLLLTGVVPGKESSRGKAVKAGKAATALVKNQFRNVQGSAFCIHSSGIFLTNQHVVGQESVVSLVLHSGTKAAPVVTAKVLRTDSALDLALLQVDGQKDLTALPLGTVDQVSETDEVIAFGFPFGQVLAADPKDYPAISVNVGKVTALREKNGELHRIQVDAVLNPGNSGGPVLDNDGKVIGVVVSGVRNNFGANAGVNFVIPVSHVTRFVARPTIVLTLPTVKAAHRHEAFEFTARAISLLPPKEPLDLELVLGAGPDGERRLPMKYVGGVYHARAVPFPKAEGPPVCRVEVKYEDGRVSGTVEDRTLRLGQRKIKLRQLRSLRLGQKPEARLDDGQRLLGKPDDLDFLPLKVGKQSLRLDLATAVEIRVEPAHEVTALSCTVEARQAGKSVGRYSAPLYIEGVSRPTLESLAEGKFVKPPRSGAPVSYLRVASSQGDYIGQGKSYSYGGQQLTVRTNNRGVTVNVGNFGGWTLNFGGPGNSFLAVGEYDGAKRFPFSGNAPGIEFTGYGRGCNMIAGKFVVWEIEVKGNQVVRLAIDFIQRCEEKMPPLYGSLRINSTFH